MAKTVFTAAVLLVISVAILGMVYAENNENVSLTQSNNDLPEGMERRSVDSNPGYKVVVPKGSTIRREGDLRVIEGSGEYAARRFEDYDRRLAKISEEIEELRKKVEEVQGR